MFERRPHQTDSKKIGEEILTIYDARQQSVNISDELIESVTDTPEKAAAEFARSYYETFFDTPAERMLWHAETLLRSTEQASEFYFKIRDVSQDILKIDLAEAYSVVMPDEGWRVLQTMPDGDPKVEALAKFGKNTDPLFISQARQMVYKLDPDWRRPRIENLLMIADLAQDDKALDLAYKEAMGALRADDEVSDWSTAEYFINSASQGHGAALLEAKRFILNNLGNIEQHTYHWIEEMALVSYIDELIKRGQLPLRFAVGQDQMTDFETVETAWQDGLMMYRDRVAAEYKKEIELPRFDNLYRSLYSVESDAQSNSTLRNRSDVADYIDSQAADYAGLLTERGLEGLEAVKKAADVTKPSKAKSRRELGQQIQRSRARWGESIAAMVDSLTGRRTIDQEINLYNDENIRMFRALNTAAVFRGLCIAGVSLHTADKNT